MTEKNKKKTIIIHQQFLKLCSKIRKKNAISEILFDSIMYIDFFQF